MLKKHNPIKQYCPNCSGEAIREGNKITCEVCDAVFEIKKTGAANVLQLGRVGKIESRVDALEALLTPAEPEPVPGQEDLSAEELAELEAEAATDEEDILPP